MASLSGTLSRFYTTPASHQPNLLGFSQRYITLLHDYHLASAKTFLASLSGTLSHFYTTPASHQPKPIGFSQQYIVAILHDPASHQPNLLGFSQRYIVALLHDSRSTSAKPPWLRSAVHRRTYTRLTLRISQISWASRSGISCTSTRFSLGITHISLASQSGTSLHI